MQFLPFDKVEYEYDYIVRDIDNLIKSDVCPIDKDTKEKNYLKSQFYYVLMMK